MNLTELVEKFQEKPYMIDMGANKLSGWLKASKSDVKEAKRIVRALLNPKPNLSKLPKILILDIETSPLKAYVWRRWKQNIHLPQTISEWFMLTWSAKWLFDDKTFSARSTGKEVLAEDDSRIVSKLWKLLEEADIVVAHNGDSFDIPKINSRFILNGLGPTTPYQQIDTKKISAKQFGFSSNKLDALAIYFGLPCKLDTDFELWARCMDGDNNALKYMEEYNRYDVELLEEVYLRLRPWVKSHPNVGLYLEADIPVCANCGSHKLKRNGNYFTQVGKFDTYRCECGAISRVRKSSYGKDKRANLIISTAR